MKAGPLARWYGLLAYWFVFALLTLHQAQYPGLMLHPERWRYPWGAVFAVWAVLAVCVGLLQLILRPASYRNSWGRLLGALAYSATLLVLGFASVVTDMPGYYYVPAQFSAITMACMFAFALIQVVNAVRRRNRRS